MSLETLSAFTYTGRATGAFYFDVAESSGNEQVAVEITLLNEGLDTAGQPIAGQTVWWFGTFADIKPGSQSKTSATDVTLKSLRALGWKTDDISKLEGLGENEAELVIGPETYNGKTKNKIKFINRPGEGGRPQPKKELTGGALTAFAARMANAARASRAGGGAAPAASAPAFRVGGNGRPAPAPAPAKPWDGQGADPSAEPPF